MLSTHEQLVTSLEERIITSADVAYESVSMESGAPLDLIHCTEGFCNPVTDLIVANLLESGIDASRTNRVVWPERKWGPNGERIAILSQPEMPSLHHAFGKVIVEKNDTYDLKFFDPTWQQLLPAELRTADLPKVLFGTPQEVVDQARSYGIVNESILDLWSAKRIAS